MHGGMERQAVNRCILRWRIRRASETRAVTHETSMQDLAARTRLGAKGGKQRKHDHTAGGHVTLPGDPKGGLVVGGCMMIRGHEAQRVLRRCRLPEQGGNSSAAVTRLVAHNRVHTW